MSLAVVTLAIGRTLASRVPGWERVRDEAAVRAREAVLSLDRILAAALALRALGGGGA